MICGSLRSYLKSIKLKSKLKKNSQSTILNLPLLFKNDNDHFIRLYNNGLIKEFK